MKNSIMAFGLFLTLLFNFSDSKACTAEAHCKDGSTVWCMGIDLVHSSAGLIHPAHCSGIHGEYVKCINWNGSNPQIKYCPGTEFGKPVVPKRYN